MTRLASLQGLEECSRRPHTSPQRTPRAIEEKVVELREKHGWAGKKLSRLLEREGISLSPSTVDRILKRRGLVRTNRASLPPSDLSGSFRMSYGRWTSRESIGYEVAAGAIHSVCWMITVEFRRGDSPSANRIPKLCRRVSSPPLNGNGLPESILADHGTPWWCSSNGHGLTTLSVGLIWSRAST